MGPFVRNWCPVNSICCFADNINNFFPLVVHAQDLFGLPKWVWPSMNRYRMLLVQTFTKLPPSKNSPNRERIVCKTTKSQIATKVWKMIWNSCTNTTQDETKLHACWPDGRACRAGRAATGSWNWTTNHVWEWRGSVATHLRKFAP